MTEPNNNPAEPPALPLWRVMEEAGDEGSRQAVMNFNGFAIAAEIEALRDVMLPDEPEPWLVDPAESDNSLAITAMYCERQRLRAWLTEQARIAREGG